MDQVEKEIRDLKAFIAYNVLVSKIDHELFQLSKKTSRTLFSAKEVFQQIAGYIYPNSFSDFTPYELENYKIKVAEYLSERSELDPALREKYLRTTYAIIGCSFIIAAFDSKVQMISVSKQGGLFFTDVRDQIELDSEASIPYSSLKQINQAIENAIVEAGDYFTDEEVDEIRKKAIAIS